MNDEVHYSSMEQFSLWAIAVFGFLVINGAFAYGLLFRPEVLWEAMSNPISAAFIVEAFLLVGLLAYLFSKWKVGRLPWWWFVFLSLLGSIAFALPIFLLWPSRKAPA